MSVDARPSGQTGGPVRRAKAAAETRLLSGAGAGDPITSTS